MISDFPSDGGLIRCKHSPRIVVLGPCASGKTTLVNSLLQLDVDAYLVAQEHSVIPRMFRRRNPDVVVYLDVSYEELKKRRKISWFKKRLDAQHERLKIARIEADLYVNTDGLTPNEVRDRVIHFLEGERGFCRI